MRAAKHHALSATVEQLDGVTNAIVAYEATAGACTISASAKARLASARLALTTLMEAVAGERKEISSAAKKLLTTLQRKDLDYARVDEAAYRELRKRGLAAVIFGTAGNRVFATRAGKNAK